MENLRWVQITFSFITGGAFGAVLKIAYDWWQGRQQPVLTKIDVDRIFSSSPFESDMQANVTVKQEGTTWSFSNLSLAKVEISNGGNADRGVFEFGITLPNTHRTILCECSGEDRHHAIACTEAPSLKNQCSTIDFTCTPFNRKDSYTLKLYVTSESDAIRPSDVRLTSAAPVRIARSPSAAELSRRYRIGISMAAAISAAIMGILVNLLSQLFSR